MGGGLWGIENEGVHIMYTLYLLIVNLYSNRLHTNFASALHNLLDFQKDLYQKTFV